MYILTKEMYHAAFDKDLPLGRMKLFKGLQSELIEEIGSCGEVLSFQKGRLRVRVRVIWCALLPER